MDLQYQGFRCKEFHVSQGSVPFVLQIRHAGLFSISPRRVKGLLRIGRTIRRGHVNHRQRANLRQTGVVVTVMVRSVVNYSGRQCVQANFAERMTRSLPGVNLSSKATSHLIRVTQAAIVKDRRRIPITVSNMRVFGVLANHLYHLLQVAPFVRRTISLRAVCLTNQGRRLPWPTDPRAQGNGQVRNAFSSDRVLRFRERIVLIRRLFSGKRVRVHRARRVTCRIALTSNVRISTVPRRLIMERASRAQRAFRTFFMSQVKGVSVLHVVIAVLVRFQGMLRVPKVRRAVRIYVRAFECRTRCIERQIYQWYQVLQFTRCEILYTKSLRRTGRTR